MRKSRALSDVCRALKVISDKKTEETRKRKKESEQAHEEPFGKLIFINN